MLLELRSVNFRAGSQIVKKILSLGAGVAALWAVGFILFVANLPRATSDMNAAARHTGADGVVVYTGGGGVRISTAMSLFADGVGQRLLISGVHPDTSAARLSDFWVGAKDLFDCCVDLGRAALTTEGNAAELRDWAQSHRYQNLVLVTSDYHMPRALSVTRARMPDANITAFPVTSGYLDKNGFPSSPDAFMRLAGEYTKYLLARAKAVFRIGGR